MLYSQKFIKRLCKNEVQYFKCIPEAERSGKEFSTDLNLVECLKCIGYEDALHKRYDDLFLQI